MTDTERFESLFRAHRRAVLGYVLRRTDPTTAEEVVADTFLVCWRRLEVVPGDALPWLLGVARRCLANRRRAATRSGALLDRVRAAPAPAGGRDPGELLDARDTVRLAFAELPESDREVLRLAAWEELEPAAAARALGCTRAAYRVRLHRARRRLAARLAAAEGTTCPNHAVIEEAT